MKAEDSPQIKRLKRSIKEHFKEEDKLINKKSLDQMKKTIEHWLSRHKPERVKWTKRPVKLFDENKHSEKTKSKVVSSLRDKIKSEFSKLPKSLSGRIKK